MKMRVTQSPGALPLRADGAVVTESEHEVLVRFYFDSPAHPEGVWELSDGPPEVRVIAREIVATVSLSPGATRQLHKTLGGTSHVAG